MNSASIKNIEVMLGVERELIEFFKLLALKDEGLLQQLAKNESFAIDNKKCCFTLPYLHAFLCNAGKEISQVQYSIFRKQIFNSHINQAIKPTGAQIVIIENSGKVDHSIYALVWR